HIPAPGTTRLRSIFSPTVSTRISQPMTPAGKSKRFPTTSAVGELWSSTPKAWLEHMLFCTRPCSACSKLTQVSLSSQLLPLTVACTDGVPNTRFARSTTWKQYVLGVCDERHELSVILSTLGRGTR